MAPNPSQFPLGAPTTSGTEITVDQWLNSPTTITRALADMIVQSEDFFVGEVFASIGNVSGGAILYNPVLANNLYADRDVQEIEPGAEYPILTSDIGEPKVARVRKFGGKIYISDEARQRNRIDIWNREQMKLANTLAAQLNAVAMAVLDAAIVDRDRSTGGVRTASGGSWVDATRVRLADTNPAATPAADFAAVVKRAREERQGLRFDTLIVNPQEAMHLDLIYGERPGGVEGVLSRFGIRRMFVSSYQRAGQAKFVAARQVGVVGTEAPMGTVTYREEGRDVTWVQSRAKPVIAVDNRWGIWELTDLDRSSS